MTGYAFSVAEAPLRADVRRRWVAAAIALAVGAAALALVFRPEEAEALRVWLASTAYNHCFLVVPVALFLLWDRRHWLAAAVPQPAPWIAAAALPLALGWFLAERVGIWEARQLLALSLLQVLFLAVLGPHCWRTLSAPLLYLYFLVPVGAFLVPSLQKFTAHFMASGLDVLGIPNYSTGVTIEIPEGAFRVAQACAGLRFLVASVAFGALYGCVIYTSPVRRLLFMALSLVVPIIANGFRALGLVVLAHLLGSAAAVETDHILYGWLFFSIVTFALILVGLPFRQTARRAVAAPQPGRRGPVPALAAAAAAAVILFAAAPRLFADRLDGISARAVSAAAGIASGPRFPVRPDCAAAPLPGGWAAGIPRALPGIDHSRAYRCAEGLFVVTVHRYPARVSARPLLAFLHPQLAARGSRPAASRVFEAGSGAAAQRWTIAEFDRGGRYAAIASALWIDGRPADGALGSRLRQAANALSRTPVAPVAAVVTYADSDGRGPAAGRRALDRFLSVMASRPLSP